MINSIKPFIFNNKIINILAQPSPITQLILVIISLVCLFLYLDFKTFCLSIKFMSIFIVFYNKIEKKYKEKKIDYKRIKKIDENNILDISVFYSGKIIYITDSHIKILNNNNYELLQMIQICLSTSIDIKDENNFLITSKINEQITTWRKQNNLFIINKTIFKVGNVNFAKYSSNNCLISISDNNILIFKEVNINYQLIMKITEICKSLLIIKSKNILVIANENCIKFRNLNTYAITKNFEEIKCNTLQNGIANIDNERIIALSNYYINVISISRQEIIKKIRFYIEPQKIIHPMKRKGIFYIVAGQNLYAYDVQNYKYLITQSLIPFSYFYLAEVIKLNEINGEKYLILKNNSIIINNY
jgi:hypothetical protein